MLKCSAALMINSFSYAPLIVVNLWEKGIALVGIVDMGDVERIGHRQRLAVDLSPSNDKDALVR